MGTISDFFFGRNRTLSELATWQGDTPPLTVQKLTLSNLFPGVDADALPMIRLEAQTIPGVMAIQNLLTAAIGPLILQAVDAKDLEKVLPTQPAWVTRIDRGAQNPFLRLARTAKDLYYEGTSLWTIDAKDGKGYPLSLSHLPFERWEYDEHGVVLIDETPTQFADVVIFEAAFEGLLLVGGRTLREARDIQRTIRSRARTQVATQILKNMGTDAEPTETELQDMLKTYTDARHSLDGAVGYVPLGYDLVTVTDSPNNWLLEAREAVIADLAKIVGIPSGLIEGAQFGSLNYTTELGQLSRFTDFNIKNFTEPINARLSMGDVTPRGTAVRLDISALQQEAPAPLTNKGTPVAPSSAPEAKTS